MRPNSSAIADTIFTVTQGQTPGDFFGMLDLGDRTGTEVVVGRKLRGIDTGSTISNGVHPAQGCADRIVLGIRITIPDNKAVGIGDPVQMTVGAVIGMGQGRI